VNLNEYSTTLLQEDVIRVSDSRVNACINPSLIFKPVLAIVCNIARAHTVTHGRVNPRTLGSFAKFSLPWIIARSSSLSEKRYSAKMLAHGARPLWTKKSSWSSTHSPGVEGAVRSRSTRSDNKWCFICRAMPGGYSIARWREGRGGREL